MIAYVAGADRHSCWHLGLADYLILSEDRKDYASSDGKWIFWRLQQTGSPGTMVGGIIKSLVVAEKQTSATPQAF